MAAFIYRCPATGKKVQGWLADEPSSENGDDVYEAVACAGLHQSASGQSEDRQDDRRLTRNKFAGALTAALASRRAPTGPPSAPNPGFLWVPPAFKMWGLRPRCQGQTAPRGVKALEYVHVRRRRILRSGSLVAEALGGKGPLPFLQDPLRLFEDVSQHWVFDAEAMRIKSPGISGTRPSGEGWRGRTTRLKVSAMRCECQKNRPLPSAHRPEGQYS